MRQRVQQLCVDLDLLPARINSDFTGSSLGCWGRGRVEMMGKQAGVQRELTEILMVDDERGDEEWREELRNEMKMMKEQMSAMGAQLGLLPS